VVDACAFLALPKAIKDAQAKRAEAFEVFIAEYLRDRGWHSDTRTVRTTREYGNDGRMHAKDLVAKWTALDSTQCFHDCVRLVVSGNSPFGDTCKLTAFASVACSIDPEFPGNCADNDQDKILTALVGVGAPRVRAGAYLLQSLSKYAEASPFDRMAMKFFATKQIDRTVGLIVIFLMDAERQKSKRGRPRSVYATNRDLEICNIVVNQPANLT
jgi:hypothetical protein